MENLVNKTVKVTLFKSNMEIVGLVVKQENDIIWVAENGNKDNQLKFFTSLDTVEVLEQWEIIDNYIEANNIKSDGYVCLGDIDYIIEGFTYQILLHWDDTVKQWHCETKHYAKYEYYENSDFDNLYKAYGNTCYRKTVKGAIQYIERWIEK